MNYIQLINRFHKRKKGFYTVNTDNYNVPLWNKFALTIKESTAYFNIGEKTLRRIIDNTDADFILYNGSKCLIKRKKFEEFLNNVNSI